MSPLLYEIIVYLVEALLSGIFLINMLEGKHHKVLHVALWCEIVLIAMLSTPSFSLFRIGFMALLEFVYTYFMFVDKPKKRVKVFFFKELLLVIASAVSYVVYAWCIDGHTAYLSSCSKR